VANEYRLEHDVLTKVWRRNLDPDTTLFATAAGTNGLSVVSGTLDVVRGEWVQLNSSNKAIRSAVGDLCAGAMPVWSGGEGRFDAVGGITAVWGPHVAKTSQFDPAGVYAPGTELTVELSSSKTRLKVAASGNYVVALVEQAPSGASVAFPDGLLQVSSHGAGYFKA